MTGEEVKQALACLYDPIGLSQASLCRYFPEVRRLGGSGERAQAMRALLLNALETLQPPATNLPLTPAVRGYELLALHYVQRLPLAEAADELHISQRQAYRDLAQALDRFAEYVAELAGEEEAPAAPDDSDSALRRELERMPPPRPQVDVGSALRAALETAQALAEARRVRLRLEGQERLPPAVSEPALLTQLLLSCLSWALRHCTGDEVRVATAAAGNAVAVTIACRARPGASLAASDIPHLGQTLAVPLHLEQTGEDLALRLLIPSRRRFTVLVIEDNPGVVELCRRILQETGGYEVIAAGDPAQAAQVAEAARPDVVILDILMPERDGWSVLRQLRAGGATRHIPVLVCSVFDEQELAAALGATGYLRKPVSARSLLEAVEACLRWRAEAGPGPATNAQ